MKKNVIKDFFLKNGMLKLISIALAFVAWVIIAMYVNPNKDVTIKNVPINIDLKSQIIVKQELNLLSSDIVVANVSVSGESYIVNNLSEKDITLTASLSSVSGAGTYDLPLQAEAKSGGKVFTITGVSPQTVRVKFDKLLSRKYTVQPEIANLTVPEGYTRLEEPQVTPGEITITGPEAELDKVAKVKVVTDLENEPISKTQTLTLPIQLFDKDDQLVESDELKLEYEMADVKLTVYKNKQVPLTIDFINVPANFPIDDLEYEISNPEIWVAGPTDQVDSMTSVNVGYVDITAITPDNNSFNFDVKLPTDFSNIERIESVTVEFNTEGMIEKNFYVNNIKAVNTPAGYDVSLITKQLNNVTIVGPKDVVSRLSNKDIVAEIDLSDRKVVSGQVEMPVNVIVPGKGLVWATGDYSAVVNIKEK
ncbi:hypothetical protein H8711_00030 [Clostridiaceae bacterium NSJ-31]|uniref:YbbR domain-containing protein n=1 Tax=Ligaoa zhengdingensis TaxID=2763658 RepID=A0A926DWU8_9FIRM|nr:CdaR family protein [Ligaoa zhengdingensis]MBC8545322.1 hypothetical protein [Ligaoa zhengdingensis]